MSHGNFAVKCTILPTPSPVEHNCEPGRFAYVKIFTIFKIMTVTCICLAFYLIIESCQYKAMPGKTVDTDDTHMIISATQWRDEEFGASCQAVWHDRK